MRSAVHLRIAAILTATVVVAAWGLTGAGQAPARTVAVDADDIGGVVTGPKGPEAGVWVIAETTDLPTRLIKSVVTDDQGRYLVPDLPKASYNVWVRGYGLVDSPEGQGRAGPAAVADRGARARREGGCALLPRAVLAGAAAGAAEERFPRHRPDRQRHLAQREEPGRMDPQHRQHRRLHRLPSARQQGHARDPAEPRHVCVIVRRMGAPRAIRTGRRRHARPLHAGGPRSRAGDVWRLDRSHRQGRTAVGCAAASAGTRTQRRRDDVGLGGSEDVPARRDRDGQAQSDRQREWADLRRARGKRRLHAGRRSANEHGHADQSEGSRSADAEYGEHQANAAVAVLG